MQYCGWAARRRPVQACSHDEDIGTSILRCVSAVTRFAASTQEELVESKIAARRLHFLAEMLLDSGRALEAIRHLQQAVKLDPDLKEAHIALCMSLEEVRDDDALRAAVAAAIVEGGVWSSPRQHPAAYLAEIASQPFWDPKIFPWVQALEAASPRIRCELEAAMNNERRSFSAHTDFKFFTTPEQDANSFAAPAVGRQGVVSSLDVLLGRSEGNEVIVTTLERGDRKTYPSKGHRVRILYEGRLAGTGEVFDRSGDEGVMFRLGKIGSGSQMPGLEAAVYQMSRGETAHLWIPASQAYGAEGGQGSELPVPPGADLEFQVTLLWIRCSKGGGSVILPLLEHPRGPKPPWARVGGGHRATGRQDGEAILRGGWHEVVLFGLQEQKQQADAQARCSAAPKAIQDLLPEAVSLAEAGAGEVVLSALSPGTDVLRHCGRANHRLTAHLGLSIPPEGPRGPDNHPACGIAVGGEWRCWEQDKITIFDDSFEHEVRNHAGSTRVVLLIRFWHPSLDTADKRDMALEDIQASLARAQRLRTLPPLAPAYAEPGPLLEEHLLGRRW
eukprot:s129_g32.t2